MTTLTSPSAQWDDMTNEEKIDWLATNFMKWHSTTMRDGIFRWLNEDNKFMGYKDTLYPMIDRDGQLIILWNPLTDWNHTMELVEKARMDGFDLQSDLVSTQEEICEEIFTIYHQQK